MKRIVFFFLPLVFILFFAGCASNQLSNTENKQTEEKLRFEDWKYKGFGYELPDWVEPAIEEKKSKVIKYQPELADSTVEIFSGRGINIDQADAAAKEAASNAMAESGQIYELYDNYWVKEWGEVESPYISVYIYYLK